MILIHLSSSPNANSVTLTIRKIEQAILNAGHHVMIITTKSGDLNNTHIDGKHPNRTVLFLDNSIPIPFLNDPNHPELNYELGFSLSRTLRAKIAEFEPSLIHITVPDSTCLHLIQYAREKELPLMGTYHSNIPEYMTHYRGIGWLKHVLSAFFRHQYNFLQALYVPTPFIHKHLTDTCKMDKVTKLGIWGRGIDLDQFSPKYHSRKFRKEMGFDDTDVVVLWVGRLVPEKRPDIFCHVIRRLHERNIPFRALVVGAGPCEAEIKALPNTTFAGWMSGDELSVAYASSDIFLFPSGVETFGNVTLEAAASGLPLVVEAGCSGHLVNHGVNGFACHEYDPEAFLDSTLCLVLDDARRKSMSEEGRKFSLQFEKTTVCKKMLVNYSTVTDEFYCEYGGRHANRDQIYQKEHSFLGGNHPRPMFLQVIEYVFFGLFRIMYHMATVFVYVRERMLFAPSNVFEEVAQRENSPTIAPVKSPASSSMSAQALGSIMEVEETRSSDDTEVEMEDVQIGLLVKVKADDDTDSTTSLSDESSSETCCHVPQADLKVSHILALGFVKLLQYQFLYESRLRNAFNDCCAPSKRNLRQKRKNSSFAMEQPDIQRARSDGSDGVSDDLDILVSSARDERLSLRRSNSVLLDL
jgi:glycosyltransferase involved in cell wall biosynthesis